MYIWIIVIGIILYLVLSQKGNDIKRFEKGVAGQKEVLFMSGVFDCPDFIDFQDASDIMEANYQRLKKLFSKNKEKQLEIAEDLFNYVVALVELKLSRDQYEFDMDGAIFRESIKESTEVKDNIEYKFKSLLGEEWLEMPPTYYERLKIMKKPTKQIEDQYEAGEAWKYYYKDSKNLKIHERKIREETEQKPR